MDRKNINKRAHREGQWRFPKSKDFLKQYPFFAAMLNKLWSLTWYAYIGASLLDPRFSIQYIGRYTKRAVMAEYRTPPGRGDGKIVRFSYKDYVQGAKTSYMTRIGIMFNPFNPAAGGMPMQLL